MTKPLVVGVVAAVAAGVIPIVELGATGHVHARAQRPAHARHFRDGPVHGLMLLPLADPDGHVPTADKH